MDLENLAENIKEELEGLRPGDTVEVEDLAENDLIRLREKFDKDDYSTNVKVNMLRYEDGKGPEDIEKKYILHIRRYQDA